MRSAQSLVLSIGSCLVPCSIATPQAPTQLVSVSSTGVQGNNHVGSARAAISDDGRFIAFESTASNLVSGDGNATVDIFVRDRLLGTTELASVSTAGVISNGSSGGPSLSDDGRYVVFHSIATNLVPGDANGTTDVFLRDRASGTTIRVSEPSGGGEGNNLSSLGFISGDGSAVSFRSTATNLVAGDTNAKADIFVRELSTGVVTRVSVSSSGAEANGDSQVPGLSDDGSLVVFSSQASNLWPLDTNGSIDVFVHDRNTGTTELADRTTSGATPHGGAFTNCWISGDGSTVVFESWSPDFGGVPAVFQIFAFERSSGVVSPVSRSFLGAWAEEFCVRPSISDDGRYVAFETTSVILVNQDFEEKNDVFVADRISREVLRVSMNQSGESAAGNSGAAMIAGNGRFVSFSSGAPDLVPGDNNNRSDVFVHDTAATQPVGYCAGKLTSGGCLPRTSSSGLPSLTQPSGFVIEAFDVTASKSGLLIYGRSPASTPFMGGLLCMGAPIKRSRVLSSGGTGGCSGSFAFDFNAWMAGGFDPSIAAGNVLYAQFWFRDPQSMSGGTGLSDALRFVVYI